ncbi:MAG: hypothetical protein R2879_14700 [Saprospiraceae bacterium]
MIAGIDYGSKLAGTTYVAYDQNGQIHLTGVEKKKDADLWLQNLIPELKPEYIFMDAPLSLPGVYSGDGEDYFYRKADRDCMAMSPMFLGGLTARAMRLKAFFKKIDLKIFETYPARVVDTQPGLPDLYRKKDKNALQPFVEKLEKLLPYDFAKRPETWHEADAILAWLSGFRYAMGKALSFGDEKEGLIWV